MTSKVKVFISYSHEDDAGCCDLIKNFGALRQEEIIETWSDHDITPGATWAEEISNALEAADLILLLVSPGFINSKFCYCTEMKRAVERHKAGTASVVPIVIEDCYWEPAPFSQFQGLPKNLKPIATVPKRQRNAVYKEVVAAIHQTVKTIAERKAKAASSATSKTKEDGRFRDRALRLKEFKKELAKSLLPSSAAVDALNAVAVQRGYPQVVLTHGPDAERVDLLMTLNFSEAVTVLQAAFTRLDGDDEGMRAIKGVARHLIPYVFIVGAGMADTQISWERVTGGGVIGLKAGHESFAEIVAAGLDIRPTRFSGDVRDIRSWPTSSFSISDAPPSGIYGDQDDVSLREDLWRKVRPPLPPGPLSPEQRNAAINNQLKTFAERRGIRYYMIINDAPSGAATAKRERLSKRYPALAITALDPKLYSLHQELFNDLRDLLAE